MSAMGAVALAAALVPSGARKLAGDTVLGPGQAKVVAKFCFDFNPQCRDATPCQHPPGQLDMQVWDAKVERFFSEAEPKVSLALLDDEYFSFPEVSQVWGEANCTDVAKAAKKAVPLHWPAISSEKGQFLNTVVLEKIRPRWWYIALASCSDQSLSMRYQLSVANVLQGANAELSMDEIGIITVCLLCSLSFSALCALHLKSLQDWSILAPAGGRLLAASLLLASLGHVAWLAYFRSYRDSGVPPWFLATLGRASLVAAKSCLQILLMLLARGDCVCTPGIAWVRQREMIMGMVAFGLLGLALEVWGDREASGSPIEYMYDTRPGVALIALEMLWLYAYTSRCWQTWSDETRIRPRHFYKRFASVLSLWFVTLPGVAALASVLAPWVRFRVVFAVSGLAHFCASGILVYIYHPSVAPDLFEMKAKHREAASNEELKGFLEASFGACDSEML
ncbi:unnamed protein product [Effrenium voratum]|nr:unnamed protein product [Effrenium voratum]